MARLSCNLSRLAWLPLVLLGCTFDPKLPSDALILCGPNGECPRDWVCPTGGTYCRPAGQVDQPTLTLVSVDPPIGRDQAVMTFVVRSTEALARPPTLLLEAGAFSTTLSTPVESGDGYVDTTWRLPITAQINDGTVSISGTVTTVQGDTFHGLPVGQFSVDRQAPAVVKESSSVAPRYAQPQTRVFIRVKLTEPVKPTVRLIADETLGDGTSIRRLAPLAPLSLEGDVASFEFMVPADAVTGTWQFELLEVVDLAGNPAVDRQLLGSVVVNALNVDATKPVIQALGLAGQTFSAVASHNQFSVPIRVTDNDSMVEVLLCFAERACQSVVNGTDVPITVASTDLEGGRVVEVRATDRAGNFSFIRETVTLDFTPPRLVGSSDFLTPPTGCPLVQVTTLGALGTHTVDFSINEPALGQPQVSLGALPYSQAMQSGGRDFRYTLQPGLQAQSTSGPVTVQLSDLVGNVATLSLVSLLTVDTVPPEPLGADEQAKLLYQRVPWGAVRTQGLPRFSLVGSAGALQPTDAVVVFETADLSSQKLGQAVAQADGSLPRIDFTLVDRPRIWAQRFDSACNAASLQPQAIENVEWLGSGATGVGSQPNPHRLIERDDERTFSLSEDVWGRPPFLAGAAQQTPVRVSTGRWALAENGASPAALKPRTFMAFAWDTLHNRMLIFGGDGPAQPELAETWLFEGNQWRQVTTPPALIARTGAQMVFDPDNDRFILRGGFYNGASAIADCWQFREGQWSAIQVPSSMTSGYTSMMAYDPDHHRVVSFGGQYTNLALDETWQLVGDTWSPVASTLTPGRRAAGQLTWHAARHSLVVFGSYLAPGNPNDTWELVDQQWVRISAGGPTQPPARSSQSTIYDPVRRRLVMFGGGATLNDTWALGATDTGWVPVPSTLSPLPRYQAGMVVNPDDGSVFLIGGVNSGLATNTLLLSDAWVLRGDQWSPVDSSQVVQRSGHATVWDPANRRAIVFGGRSTVDPVNWKADTWQFDGAQLTPVFGLQAPAPRADARLVFDEREGRALLFGGTADAGPLRDLWELRDGRWAPLATPPAGYRARVAPPVAMAGDGRMLVGNGFTPDGGIANDHWLWSQNSWSLVPNPSSLPGRAGAMLVYDNVSDRFLSFGGRTVDGGAADGGSYLSETWAFTNSWQQIISNYVPNPRARALVSVNTVTGQPTLCGGTWPLAFINPADGGVTIVETTSPDCAALVNDQWQQVSVANQFLINGTATLTFDPANNRSVHFGGVGLPFSNKAAFLDATTWRWDAGFSPTVAPLGRSAHETWYDSRGRRLVTLGGQLAFQAPPIVDSWALSGTEWAPVLASGLMSGRINHATVYDSLRGRSLVFGGLDGTGRLLSDTWALSGTRARGRSVVVRYDVSSVLPRGATLTSVTPSFMASGRSAAITNPLPSGASLLPDGGALWADGGTVTQADAGTFFVRAQLTGGAQLETWNVTTGATVVLATVQSSSRDLFDGQRRGPDGGLVADGTELLTATLVNSPDAGVGADLLPAIQAGAVMQFGVTTRGGSALTVTPPIISELAVDSAELSIRYRVP